MTKTAKTATGAAIALISSIALMFLMRANAPRHAHMFEAVQAGTHPMTTMWSEMGWMMALGPVTGILFFGGIVTFVVLLVRFFAKSD
ncbi:hypothetical protein [Aquamicrobium zhengzhouense]|uniref:Uncharacterized protein n=1 Tax=Aquamicrobium zhengzhouense TaxID=2781738 RepID=A0ABS0SB63_9HYPH|nr:hypothetical protein [Aquamicrobium zhengzhouense]MBI1620534.1 hypothetical protein [Aquamicrobium zhengzhouense]